MKGAQPPTKGATIGYALPVANTRASAISWVIPEYVMTLSDDDDSNDSQIRKAQADKVIFKDLCNLAGRSALIEAAEDSSNEDHDTRNGNPRKGIRFGTRPGIDQEQRS
jgi:xanthine dehydrogenase iron-sulfur cluster and FAD-binding subunit A